KEPPSGATITELGQGEEEPAGRGPARPGGDCYLAQRQLRVLGIEGLDHCQPTLQRLDEVEAAVGQRRPPDPFGAVELPGHSAPPSPAPARADRRRSNPGSAGSASG